MVNTVDQADVDFLVRDVEAMKKVLVRDRTALRPQLEAMIWRAQELEARAAGGQFETSIKHARDLLADLKQGLASESYGWSVAG